MNENINLCEILKGHEGETFYSPLFGNITLSEVRKGYVYPLIFTIGGILYYFTSDGKFNLGNAECLLFPSKDQRNWNKWIEEHNSKVPKTWSKLVEHIQPILYAEISYKSDGHYISVSEDCGGTPIEKAALALFKIHQLIEVGYGGNVTDEEWRNNNIKKWYFAPNTYYSPEDGNDMWDIVYAQYYNYKRNFAFRTAKQAEDFLSHPENVQLLKDYFMI